MQDDAATRRAARAGWPVRVSRLGDEPDGPPTTAGDRLAMMWELARQAWVMSGRELPSYERADMPVRVLRGGEAERE